MNDLVDVHDLAAEEIASLYKLTDRIKRDPRLYAGAHPNRSLLMLFAKPSTRTRLSFEAGMTQLGGHAIDLAQERSQIERGEPLRDVAGVAGRYVDVIMARLYDHENVLELADHADVPVINGLTDLLHPCQALSDCYTLRELDASSLAFVGDGNNVANSLVQTCAKLGVECTVATPEGHEPDGRILDRAGDAVRVLHDPVEAVSGVDAVYTDAWVSMGEDVDREEKLAAFESFQVDEDLMAHAAPNAAFMHCLPAHRGEEVAESVIDGPQSVVYDQAENRLHVQKAILHALLEDRERADRSHRQE